MKYLKLLRIQQWYKNLLVFLALIFSGSLLDKGAIINALLAFASFCALSSATYVINDLADKNKDRVHPEKCNRPIASGRVGTIEAFLIIFLLTIIGFGIAVFLPRTFLYAALAYFTLSQLYTAWLKQEEFADVLTIAVNFVIRAMAGAFAIYVWPSPWLILGVFFLALFLVFGKRRSELVLLKEQAQNQRRTLSTYTPEIISQLNSLATTSLVISYTLYVFFGQHQLLYITLPIALYTIFRYEGFIAIGNKISRHPEYVFTDWRMMTAMIVWGTLTIAILYFFP